MSKTPESACWLIGIWVLLCLLSWKVKSFFNPLLYSFLVSFDGKVQHSIDITTFSRYWITCQPFSYPCQFCLDALWRRACLRLLPWPEIISSKKQVKVSICQDQPGKRERGLPSNPLELKEDLFLLTYAWVAQTRTFSSQSFFVLSMQSLVRETEALFTCPCVLHFQQQGQPLNSAAMDKWGQATSL